MMLSEVQKNVEYAHEYQLAEKWLNEYIDRIDSSKRWSAGGNKFLGGTVFISDRQFIFLLELTMRSSKLIDRSPRQTSTGTKKLFAFVAALNVAAALPGCAVFPQSSNAAVDQTITADVETRFGQNTELEGPNLINVQTINRVVYLNGLVSSGLQRSDAEVAANQVQGVDKVVNSIAVAH
jgi:hypothetical protein